MAASLEEFLNAQAKNRPVPMHAVATTIQGIAAAALEMGQLIGSGPLASCFRARRSMNGEGDEQKGLDVHADEIFLNACSDAPVAAYASEERLEAVTFDPRAPLAVAIDPVDGSSNIDTNISIGTIFSILPATGGPGASPAAPFFQPGHRQLAAGFFIYGPQLALALTLGQGTHLFVHSPRLSSFVQLPDLSEISPRTQEFAINASNYRHWDEGVRLYVDDCLKGSDGPREKDFNMRWNASMVAECYRILMRGGVYLYPGDARKGYRHGRLRLVYEANPIAMLIEQAGGAATDTVNRILDLQPESLHQRVPLVFGSSREVMRIARYHTEPSLIAERAPLFGHRGLLRA